MMRQEVLTRFKTCIILENCPGELQKDFMDYLYEVSKVAFDYVSIEILIKISRGLKSSRPFLSVALENE